MFELDSWTIDLLHAIGINDVIDIDSPVIEVNTDDFYIKFMSNYGVRDNEQGQAFKNWMDKNNIQYKQAQIRSFIVDTKKFETVFGQSIS